jgi:signal transduction histidine kinase
MFFDDRLTTVLRQDATSETARRTQFRQLLDILGNRKFAPTGRTDPSLLAAAWLRMDALGRSIPARDRAAMIREPSWRFRSPDLAAHLADFEPEVASAALNRAQLSGEDWAALIPRLPLRARGFLRLRRDLPLDAIAVLERLGVHDRGLPVPISQTPAQQEADPTTNDNEPGPGEDRDTPFELAPEAIIEPDPIDPIDPIEAGRSEISALVERIARFRRTRETLDANDLIDSERSPRLPLDEVAVPQRKLLTCFGFSTDAAGRIEWAEGQAAPMVIGTRLIRPQALGENLQERDDAAAITRAFLARQPIESLHSELFGAPAIAGEWCLDAQPQFTLEGQFTGYVGRFQRLVDEEAKNADAASKQGDRIRQLLHELRTPVTAVQGYAEVIQQQLFGHAPHEYRALAAAIAADAAFILAGFEELDRLARLEIGTLKLEAGKSDLGRIARQTGRQLAQVLAPRMAGLKIEIEAEADLFVPIDIEDTERLVWRYLATLAGACDANETLDAQLGIQGETVVLACDLPQALLGEDDIFSNTTKPVVTAINAGVFGAGFALRLARAEARASGGSLLRDGDRVFLSLVRLEKGHETPILTGTQDSNSH